MDSGHRRLRQIRRLPPAPQRRSWYLLRWRSLPEYVTVSTRPASRLACTHIVCLSGTRRQRKSLLDWRLDARLALCILV